MVVPPKSVAKSSLTSFEVEVEEPDALPKSVAMSCLAPCEVAEVDPDA